jgi:hypothetical protein
MLKALLSHRGRATGSPSHNRTQIRVRDRESHKLAVGCAWRTRNGIPVCSLEVARCLGCHDWILRAFLAGGVHDDSLARPLSGWSIQDCGPEPEGKKKELRRFGDLEGQGREIVTAAPAPKHGHVIDIMEALKRSMERVPVKKTAASAKKKRAKAS